MRHVTRPSCIVMAVALGLLACGSSDERGSDPKSSAGSGGTAGSAATMGGAGTSGSTGTSGSAGAAGAGGNAGKPPDGTVGRDPNARWDKTLGGFNRDLPEPRMPCPNEDFRSYGACVAVSGTYNGELLDVTNIGETAFVYLNGGFRAAGLDITMAPNDVIEIGVRLGMLVAPTAPSTFQTPAPGVDPNNAAVSVTRDARKFESHVNNQPTDTHEIEYRMAGELWFAQSRADGPRFEQLLADFALSMTPKSGCQPDSAGLGCDRVRLRGTIRSATLRTLEAP
jgi:hypothetical protein